MNVAHDSAFLPMLLALALAGCGGSVTTLGPGDGGGPQGDSGPAQDSGTQDSAPGDAQPIPDSGPLDSSPPDAGPWSPLCPASPPAVGSSCSTDQLQCEYGSAWWSVSCDAVLQCQGGAWTVSHPSYNPCTPAPGPNPSSCPADYAQVPQGASCNEGTDQCYYPQGVCACQVPLGGPVMIDGGNAYWGCVPEQGCPWPRPRLGTACTATGTYCTYETCSYGQTCQNGVWQGTAEACAGAAGGPGQ